MKPKDHNGAFPDWAALTPKYAAGELPRRLAAAEAEVAALEASEPKGFEDLVWRLDDATRPLWDLWGMVRHLSSVMNSAAWRRVEEDFQPRLVAFSSPAEFAACHSTAIILPWTERIASS